jgi:Sulfotransferase domain
VTIRIAMWSGPRNISTAMMRAFENRRDTAVVDEPFYGFYLKETGLAHPMYREVIASQPTAPEVIARQMAQDDPGTEIYYQKHMTHHMLEGIELGWIRNLHNCFLIRDPRYVVQSYSRKMSSISEADIGMKRQYELYGEISRICARDIPVIDASRFLSNPEGSLRSLCDKFGISFTPDMLHWPPGRRKSDGIWAAHWYDAVERSSGFQAYTEPEISLCAEHRGIVEEADKYYQLMLARC